MKNLDIRIGAILGAMPMSVALAAEFGHPREAITEQAGRGLPPYVATVDVSGIPSEGYRGEPNTTVLSVWVGPYNDVIGLGWDVVLRTIAPASWLSDIAVLVTNSANPPFSGFVLHPAPFDGFPGGPTMYTSDGIHSLNSYGVPHLEVLADGLIRLEFFEFVIDAPGEVEGIWESGNLYFQTESPIPDITSPGSACIVMSQALFLIRRRRHMFAR